MKRIISTLLVCALLLGCVLTMASCSKILMGKYELDAGIGSKTYEFSIPNKVVITYEVLTVEKTIEGTYKIAEAEDGNLEITFTFAGEEEADEYAGTFSFVQGEENGIKYVKIGGLKYTMVD